MSSNRNKPPFQWAFIALFVTIAIITIVIGSVYLVNLKSTVINTKKDEINGFADLKVSQIVRWWHERLGDAILIKNNSSLINQVNDFLTKENNFKEKEDIARLFQTYLSTFDYQSAEIIDDEGIVRFILPEGVPIQDMYLHPLIPEVFKTKNVMLTDIHQSGRKKPTQIDLIIPLEGERKLIDRGISAIIFTINPEKVLYPILRSWPSSSKTSETLLVRQEGDSVVYLNPLRHRVNDSILLKRSMNDTNLIAVKAVKGFVGIIEGKDYRDIPVIGATKRIPGSGWYMVSKVDLSEVDEEIRNQIIAAVLFIILFVCAFGAFTGWTIWHQRVRFYRNKYESELEQMALRKHFNYVLKYANDIILLMDSDLNIAEVNDRAIEIYQYSHEEIIGMNVRMLRLPEYDKQLDEKIEILRQSGSATYETYHRRKDGTIFPVEISARLFEVEGKQYFQSIGRDITERRKIETNLNQLLKRYNIATRAGKLAVWDWDIKNDQLLWDDRVYELFGVTKGEMAPVYDSWLRILHPQDVEKANLHIRNALTGKNEYDTEFRVIHPDGTVKYIKAYGQVVNDQDGNPSRLIGINYDITERKIAELSLQITEQTYRDLFETVSDAIYIHKPDGVFMDVNRGAVEMYGYSREELVGMTPADVGAPDKNDLGKLKEILSRVFETGKSEQFEFWGKRKNGEIFPKEVVSNKGKYFGQDVIISTARDITLRKNYEDQLRNAKEKAEESDRLKTAFLHNISHEIRTPMNAIVGFTALLDEPDLDTQSRKHFIDIIYQSTNQLLGIISDIVDISNIETGQVKLNFSEVNLNTIISNLYDQYSITADQKKLLLHYEIPLPDERADIYTDRTKLIQILSNLLNNAFKFTSQGSVQFGYRIYGNNIEFFVKDSGIGIPEDKVGRVFDRFYQIENDSSRRYSGAGLGLSISKAYVEILGGKIWLKSRPGKGSEFYFTHPF